MFYKEYNKEYIVLDVNQGDTGPNPPISAKGHPEQATALQPDVTLLSLSQGCSEGKIGKSPVHLRLFREGLAARAMRQTS